MNGCAEVSLNLLAPGEAVDLLLGTAQIKDDDAAVSAAAEEIAVLCGNLPLYLTICGGVIAGYEGDPSWKTEVVGMLIEDRVGLIEDSTGDRTVERLVDSSLSMLKDEQASLTFMALGVCPEDVLVELPVAQLICGADVDVAAAGKLSSMSMRRIVKTLLDRHLLQGSVASGVQMHDIVRDLVRSRLGGGDGIRVKQRAVVAAFASAACSADGWEADGAVGLYVEQALGQHMTEALLPDPLEDTEAQAWLLHPQDIVVANAATAVGLASLECMSAAKEAAGDLVGAARIAWASRAVKLLPAHIRTALTFRVAGLLESADDPSCVDFEADVLGAASLEDFGSDRANKAGARRVALLQASGVATFDSMWAVYLADASAGFTVVIGACMGGWPHCTADVRSGNSQMRQTLLTPAVEASRHFNLPFERHLAALLHSFHCIVTSSSCDMDDWNPLLVGGEAALEEALAHYTESNQQCGKDLKRSAVQMDWYRFGHAGAILALFFGNLPPFTQWAVDTATAHKELDLPHTGDYATEINEVVHARYCCALLASLNRPAEALALLEAMGFAWSDAGFALYDTWFAAISQAFPNMVKDADAAYHRLVLYLASPQTAALDAEVSAWIPASAALAQHERDQFFCQQWTLWGILDLAAAAFLRLGRDDDAAEAARILVSPEHHCAQPRNLARGHGVLGQLAAKRGDLEEASGHFARGMEAAKASRFPLEEVLIARGWKRAVGESAAAAADAAIDAACAQMGKSRAQLAQVL